MGILGRSDAAATGFNASGPGGSSGLSYGWGGDGLRANVAGLPGTGYGAGGGAARGGTVNRAGGAGTSDLCIVEEYE